MPDYTTMGKTMICPCFKESITIIAKYQLSDNDDTPYEAYFKNATCPIVENSKLHPYEQSEEYKYVRCTLKNAYCPLLTDFPKVVDVRKHL